MLRDRVSKRMSRFLVNHEGSASFKGRSHPDFPTQPGEEVYICHSMRVFPHSMEIRLYRPGDGQDKEVVTIEHAHRLTFMRDIYDTTRGGVSKPEGYETLSYDQDTGVFVYTNEIEKYYEIRPIQHSPLWDQARGRRIRYRYPVPDESARLEYGLFVIVDLNHNVRYGVYWPPGG